MDTTSKRPFAVARLLAVAWPPKAATLPRRLAPLLRGAAAWAGDLVMPPLCLQCGARRFESAPLCFACLRKVERLGEGDCVRCGSPSCGEGSGGHAYWPHAFDSARFLYRMGPELSAVIHGFKYRHMARNARFLAAGLRRRKDLREWMAGFDALVPVPLHTVRRRERGYNQAELIARAFAALTDVPVDAGILRRMRATGTQTKLGKGARQANLEGAFAVSAPERVKGRRLLLVDDVFTTGSTVSACAEALRKAGAPEVGVMALALVEADASPADDFVMEMEVVAAYLA